MVRGALPRRRHLHYPGLGDTVDFRIWPGNEPPIQAGAWQAMVLRFDQTGRLAWHRGIGGVSEDEIFIIGAETLSVSADGNGLVTIGGWMDGTVAFQQDDAGDLVQVTARPTRPGSRATIPAGCSWVRSRSPPRRRAPLP